MEERVKFCKDILSKGLSYKDIMFTDETKIELGNYTHDFTRLSHQTREKLKKEKKKRIIWLIDHRENSRNP